MEPKQIQELKSFPLFSDFMAYAAREVAKLNTLDDLDVVPTDIAVEVKSRAKAFKIVSDILAPFVQDQTVATESSNKDFAM